MSLEIKVLTAFVGVNWPEENEEEISDSFVCCVCLDLLYKPIVLSCGHISCFWCVHKSMSFHRDSSCPICRNPYNHFPTICQMLHFLLRKMYPLAYKRRQLQILGEEKEMGHFSPQFDDAKTHSSQPEEGPQIASVSSVHEEEPLNRLSPAPGKEASNASNQATRTDTGICQPITVEDVLCAGCKELLFRPMGLNCGHVYCESCIVNVFDGIIRCQVCQSSHPKGLPKVSLGLQHFLEEQFPKECALRRESVKLKKVDFKDPKEASNKENTTASSSVHFSAGCDLCGMLPIVGNRYRCIDCVETIGFDLCGECYDTRPKLPGRFNQQHTPEHRFELRPIPPHPEDIWSYLACGGRLIDIAATGIFGNNYFEDPLGGSTPHSLSGGVGDAPNSSTGGRHDQDDSEPAT